MHFLRHSFVLILATASLLQPAIARGEKCDGNKLKSSGNAISSS
jgi:hypothetical protein